MARPRWQQPAATMPAGRLWLIWDRFVAIWAALNLAVVFFDITYVPLRTFWLQRNFYPIPSLPLVLPLSFLPDITKAVDPIKGIEPHRDTENYLEQFASLDEAMLKAPASGPLTPRQTQLLEQQARLTGQMIDTNPFQASNASGTLEKIKNRLRSRAGDESSKDSAALLLSPEWLKTHPWSEERQFWQKKVLPLVETNYWRSINENGQPTDEFWRFDLILFQSVFGLDILLRAIRLRRRIPGLSWKEALLRRWIDLPLLLPFWRWLRIAPVVERLQTSGLVNFEPMRAVISRGVVALLAVELFEVLALQLLDGLQQLIRSRRWPERLRALRSHQTIALNDERELVELLRIWAPLLMVQVAPRLEPELQNLLGHTLQQSLQTTVVPPPLRQLQPLMAMEQGLSRQLAAGMTDRLMALSRRTGERLGRRDDRQEALMEHVIDRFWEELANALEQGSELEMSQKLLCTFLEEFKVTYLSQINRAGIEGLIDELDLLTVKDPKLGGGLREAPATPEA